VTVDLLDTPAELCIMRAVRLFLVAVTETDDPASVYRVPKHSRWQNTEAPVCYFRQLVAGNGLDAGSFHCDDLDNLYHAEQQTGQVFVAFAVFAILIACLSLFGLVTYAAEQRIKEIGIRKVLGARVSAIVSLLSKDFALLVGIAALIAFPAAWWAMYKWLETFAYRTEISWWIFLVAGVVALANPVKSLRSE
jgi:FtsX-like permease family protein